MNKTLRQYWDGLLLFLVSAAVLFVRFLHPREMLGYYQDDFFYYLKVADSIAATGVSTFNGISLTNGYHPLWMLVLVLLRSIFHGNGFFVALQTVCLMSTVATYLLLRGIFSTCMGGMAARAGAFALAMATLQLMRYGMEITLTIPLALWLILHLVKNGAPLETRRSLGLGVLSSLVVLSRLDAGLLILLLCVASLPELLRARNPIRIALLFSCGIMPLLLLYFAMNVHFFHLLTPVSGLAKQLKTTWVPSSATWRSLLPTDRMKLLVILPQLLLLLGAFAASATHRGQANYITRILAVLTLFPLLHWFALSLLSDWELWAWYFYSLTLGCAGAYALLARASREKTACYSASAYGLLMLVYSMAYVRSGPNSITVLRSSMALAEFMDAHPGRWMMGDQAGTTAYLAHQPVVQMEGLMMDRTFLQMMRHETPLREVIAYYHGDYYAIFGNPDTHGCMTLTEPTHAGSTSPHMTGVTCAAPLVTFARGPQHIQVFRASDIR